MSNNRLFYRFHRITKWVDKHSLSSKICNECCQLSKALKDFYSECVDEEGDFKVDIFKTYESKIFDKWNHIYELITVYHGKLDGVDLYYAYLTFTSQEYDTSKPFLFNKEGVDYVASDIFYCSDRWNIERLMRCNYPIYKWYRLLKSYEEDEIFYF